MTINRDPRHPSSRRRHRRDRLGATLPEVGAVTAAGALLLAIALPSLAGARGDSMVTASLANLRLLGVAHVTYAADFNGRQLTMIPDNASMFGDGTPGGEGWVFPYQEFYGPLPGVTLGWGPVPDGGQITQYRYSPNTSTANAILMEPLSFDTLPGIGAHRFPNASQFQNYVGGRYYDPAFYAAQDDVVQSLVDPYLEEPWEYVPNPIVPGIGSIPYLSSYSMSASAMFDPSVVQRQRLDKDAGVVGGWVDPWSTDDGFRSPSLFAARYPNLKTLMLEHHWLQNRPADPCNPGIETPIYDGCEPWYFNHGIDSAPATLFYDLSARLLPNAEAVAADEMLRAQGGGFDGTWLRTTPFGEDGYFSDVAFDGTRVSHHVLTADGILGRDTLEGAALDQSSEERIRRSGSGTPGNRATSRATGLRDRLRSHD